MPTYLLTSPDGKKYKVTAPDQESALNAFRSKIGTTAPSPATVPSMGTAPDISAMLPDAKVKKSDREYEALPGWAKPLVAANDLVGLAANGLTFGFGDKALAGVDSLVGRGTYEDSLAKRRAETADSRDRAGIPGMVAEIGGSVFPAAKVAQAGLTATRLPGMWGSLGGMGIDGAGYGALTALGNDQNVTANMAIGGVLGAGGQAVAKFGGALAKPITSRLFPEKAANEVMLGAMDDAGTNAWAIAQDLQKARADGQGSYAVMDALGFPGQRLARTVTRTPSEGRTPMVEFLQKRQAGQGRRISNALVEGFGATETAAQRAATLTKRRDLRANADYSAARSAAQAVDVMPAVSKIDNLLGGAPLPSSVKDVTPDSLEGILTAVRNKLVNADGSVQTIGFDKVLRIKQELDDMIGGALRSGAGNKARMLTAVKKEIDTALRDASQPYDRAARRFASSAKAIDAVDTGKASAMRGRTEDTIPAFEKLNRMEKIGFRAGYADPLIAQTQQAAVGANKARPLINDAFDQEFPAFAVPGKAKQLGQRIGREKTMFDTLTEALGGSKTDMNLGDEAAFAVLDPSVLGNALSGNLTGAMKSAILQGISALKGQPASVRQKLSEALRVTDPAIALTNLTNAMAQINASQQQKQAIIRAMMLLGTAGAAQAQN